MEEPDRVYDLDEFVDNELEEFPDDTERRSGRASAVRSILRFPSTRDSTKRSSLKNLSRVNFGGASVLDPRKSTIGGLRKSEIQRLSVVKFGNKSTIQRLRVDSKVQPQLDDSGSVKKRPTMLCLHGWRSNSEITQFQLENLGISNKFDNTFVNGLVNSNEPADEAIGVLTPGPYYSWAARDQQERSEVNVKEVIQSLKSLLLHLLLVPESEGQADACYDLVYGFSQAVPLITLLSIESVRNFVLEEMGLPPMVRQPWNFVISSCGANSNLLKRILEHYGIPMTTLNIKLPSVHLIGINDQFKLQSEEIFKLYSDKEALPFYLDSGHEVPASARHLSYLPNEILDWYGEFELQSVTSENVEEGLPFLSGGNAPMIDITYDIQDFTSAPKTCPSKDIGIIHMGNYAQYALNEIDTSNINLIEMLRNADPTSIAIRSPGVPSLSYGTLLSFIHGSGDLRRIGANKNYTVAYLAPLGVVSAIAFLTFSAQCTAAPLDPAYTEEALLLAFKQLKPDIVVYFDGVDTGPLKNATVTTGIKTIYAKVDPDTCGLFNFEEEATNVDLSGPTLENDADNTALVLRTSGTTSQPKVCALKMSSIVSNSRIIAKNLGLTSSDIALNAMPLFHIGGLSANLLSSLAAGASVILMPKFDVDDFFDFLTSPSDPNPTWFSAVPTMHAAIQQYAETLGGKLKTSLRFIRSGAAAMPVDLAIRMEETFKCPLILTYSMTEQMPITQPPTGFSIPQKKPNSVGQSVAASMCIVDKNYRPLPYNDAGELNGEICISGPMVLDGYTANPSANGTTYFFMGGMKWFRTGDVGHLDKEGFLFLTGRNKELIKRGGEQVSPYEVEDGCYLYDAVKTCVAFAVPSKLWGQEVGAAIILEEDYTNVEPKFFQKTLYTILQDAGVERHKFPEVIKFVTEEQLLKTRSNKYIRIGLADHLGLSDSREEVKKVLKDMKNVSISEGAVGARFILAFAVMYVHIGGFDNWSRSDYLVDNALLKEWGWSHTRSWCFHTPIFFMVGGFFLAAGTHAPVTKRKDLLNFYALRIASLHPMYLVSILFCFINFISRCRPSNYIEYFERVQEPINGETFVCQATPAEMPWWATLITSIFTYGLALQSWPMFIPISWFISFYTWFSSVYIFCIFVFPWCHKPFDNVKDNIEKLWKVSAFWVVILYLYIGIFAVTFAFIDDDADPDNDGFLNWYNLCTYLLPIGWLPCFALGIALYFLFRHYHPGEKKSAWIWGAITDALSVALLACWLVYGLLPTKSVPQVVNSFLANRFLDAFISRALCPIGFLWFWGIAVGKGMTAWMFSNQFIVTWLAPASYNMFLFHQPVSEWYFAATRGEWWAYPKTFYWFSPYPIPVKTWEFPIVIIIVIGFSVIMETYVNEFLIRFFALFLSKMTGSGLKGGDADGTPEEVIISIISEITYSDSIDASTTLSEAGMSSMTTIVLAGELKKHFAGLRISARDCVGTATIGDLAKLITGRMKESKVRPDLALTNRTSVFLKESTKEGNQRSTIVRKSIRASVTV